MFEIVRDRRGYYTLFQDGIFAGNYDSQEEAAHAAAEMMREEEETD